MARRTKFEDSMQYIQAREDVIALKQRVEARTADPDACMVYRRALAITEGHHAQKKLGSPASEPMSDVEYRQWLFKYGQYVFIVVMVVCLIRLFAG